MKVELVAWTPEPFETIAKCAALCYDSEPSFKIVKGCVNSGHLSVIEHASATFIISGVSRSLTHQLVRHRLASFSQESQRYVPLDHFQTDDFVIPDVRGTMLKEPFSMLDVMGEYTDMFNYTLNAYFNLKEMGIPSDEARAVIPNACPTKIAVTMNFRQLAHFMNERLCSRASQEIRTMAQKMRQEMIDKVPKNNEESMLLAQLFVPKCKAGKVKYCPELKCCGISPSAKEVNDILNKYYGRGI